jgi:hypothetical protein
MRFAADGFRREQDVLFHSKQLQLRQQQQQEQRRRCRQQSKDVKDCDTVEEKGTAAVSLEVHAWECETMASSTGNTGEHDNDDGNGNEIEAVPQAEAAEAAVAAVASAEGGGSTSQLARKAVWCLKEQAKKKKNQQQHQQPTSSFSSSSHLVWLDWPSLSSSSSASSSSSSSLNGSDDNYDLNHDAINNDPIHKGLQGSSDGDGGSSRSGGSGSGNGVGSGVNRLVQLDSALKELHQNLPKGATMVRRTHTVINSLLVDRLIR